MLPSKRGARIVPPPVLRAARARWRAGLLVLTLICACDSGTSGRAATLLGGRHALQIGLDESVPRDGTLGRIVAARLTDGGAHVVVLDFVAPYVKVFDSRGHFVRAFVQPGSGPREARLPTALGTSGDSLILLTDATGRISLFGLSGELRAQLPDPGFAMLSAVGVCGADWMIYGPRFTGGGRPTWLHRVRIGADGITAATHSLADSLASPIIPNGVAYGLVNGPEGAVLWHTLGAERTLLEWRCGATAPRPTYRVHAGDAVRATRKPTGVTLSLRPGSRTLGGIALIGDAVLIGEHVIGRGAEGSHTEFSLIRAGRVVGRARVPGSYVIRDSRPGVGVLFSTGDPVPQVFLVREADVLGMFGRG